MLSRSVTTPAGRGAWWRIALKTTADAAGKLVTLVITVAAARALPGEAFGVLALGMTTGWLLGVATDAGLSMYFAREVSRSPWSARAVTVEVMTLRGAAAYVCAAAVALVAGGFVPGPWRMAFVLIVCAQLSGAVWETLAHLFRGLGRSEIESWLHAAQRTLTGVLALAVLAGRPRLDYLAAALLLPPVVALMAGGAIAWRVAGRQSPAGRHAEHPPRLTGGRLLREAFPLGAAALLSAFYLRCDLYFVEGWHGLDAAGDYHAVFRLVEAARLLPAAVMAVTFPALCRAATIGPVRRIGLGLTAAGTGAWVLIGAGAAPLAIGLYGDAVAPAVPALRILAVALPLFYLNYALTHQVIGWDSERAYLAIVTVAAVANVAANIALIPAFGMEGAAVATVLTELVVTAGCLHVLRTAQPAVGRIAPAAGAL